MPDTSSNDKIKTGAPDPEQDGSASSKSHFIKTKWLRRTLKVMLWVVVVLFAIPVLLYLPPVQHLAVRIASDVVRKSTGMDISIGKFSLSFPLDVELEDVAVVEASGDTMVKARSLIADVKLLPLLALDVKLNRLSLNDGYYRMVSPDSSMVLRLNAGLLEVDGKSSADISNSRIVLNKTLLRNGSLSLYMDVWKKEQKPDTAQSASTPFYIQANDLQLQDFKFAMSMLPTIDTMAVDIRNVRLTDGIVDLGKNTVKWKLASIAGGGFKYIAPDAEYVRTHPAPPSQPSSGPPMRIMGDSIAVDSLDVLYATKGIKPLPGFDPSYISLSGVEVGLKDFYNESSTVRLPLTRLRAAERSGVRIVSGHGTVGIDSVGLSLDNVEIATLYSRITASADVPFALMALQPSAPMAASLDARIGIPDVEAFLPALKQFTSFVPARKPLDLRLAAAGSLASLDLRTLSVSMPGVIGLEANGYVKNVLDYKHLSAEVDFNGTLQEPSLAAKLAGDPKLSIPAFTIKGNAAANGENYSADFNLESDAGDVAATGRVSLGPEHYEVDVHTAGLDIGRFVPDAGLGTLTASIRAAGTGFNPLSGYAMTDVSARIASLEYNRRMLENVDLDVVLAHDGQFTLKASSPNPVLDLTLNGSGTIHPDDYTFDLSADIRNLDLNALGMVDSVFVASGLISAWGNAQPGKWVYDVAFNSSDLNVTMPERVIHLPQGVSANLSADMLATDIRVESMLASVDFHGDAGMENLIDAFSKVSEELSAQIENRDVKIAELIAGVPDFNLDCNLSGRGVLWQLLEGTGLSLDSLSLAVRKDSLLTARAELLDLASGQIQLDTVRFGLDQRDAMLDYALTVRNRPGTLDEFAKVDITGYLGENRASAFLKQWNTAGQQGYRFGLTAALADSLVTAHFTPLKATIAYMPWTFNDDNYIDYSLGKMHIQANLQARSAESSIIARTQDNGNGQDELYLNVENLHVQDFLKMWAFAPPVKGDLDVDMHINYLGDRFEGNGEIGLENVIYERTRIGNFNLGLDASYGFNGSTDLNAALKVNGHPALGAYVNLVNGPEGMQPDSIGVSLTHFPLAVANPFTGGTVTLSGYLDGDMQMEGSFAKPVLNGFIRFDSVSAKIPMAGANLKFNDDKLTVADNIIGFKDFNIYGENSNPISINGKVDATRFSDISIDMRANANNFQLVKSDKRSKADLFGKVFLNIAAEAKGPLHALNLIGNVNILGTTDATYRLNMEPAELKAQSDGDIVKFVNFNDSVQVADADSIATSPLAMRINADLTISPGAQLEVLLSTNGTDKVELAPTARLSYFQNFMGDMALNGTLTLGEGYVRYAVPVIGEKMFVFNPRSSVIWNGNVLDPVLNITATDDVKANVTNGSNSRLVNFLVTLNAHNTLNNMEVNFDLATNDDLAIQNELQSMSADQRQTQAMNLLLYGQYTGQNTKASVASGNMLYSFLESQLNSWAAKNIRGVDLSFGVSQYDKMSNGVSNTETSYSYQVSKSLFNNRFKVSVGGNYSTDSADDEIAQNLVSDVSVEYILKQTATTDMSVRLFRHAGYESILEGEITEMGAGFVLKRRLENLKSLFRIRWGKRKNRQQPSDSIKEAALPQRVNKPESSDSVTDGNSHLNL